MSDIKTLEMPKWGLSMEEGTIVQWLVPEGGSFTKGQEICEIETSKIVNMFEAPFDGILRRVICQVGETVPVGAVIALVAELSVSDAELDAYAATLGTSAPASVASSEQVDAVAPASVAMPGAAVPSRTAASVPSVSDKPVAPPGQTQVPASLQGITDPAQVNATPHAVRQAVRLGVDLRKVSGSGREGRISVADLKKAITAAGGSVAPVVLPARSVKPPRSMGDDSMVAATPLARRLAVQLGINLHDCRASGSHGRVCRADVQAAAWLRDGYGSQQQQVQESLALTAASDFENVPMSGMRRAIAARLQESKHNSPHFRLTVDLDLDRLSAFRKEVNASIPGVKVSVNDLLIKACAHALVTVPDVNVQFDEASQSIRRFADADISVAVALSTGLITPIVRSANRKSVSEISREIHALVTKAKAGTLKPEEFQGGTFSVSNLGMLGVRQFDAIINPPQGAILAIGAGEERVVVRDGQIVTRQQLTVSLSCDHRVIDGALGALFLKELKRLVETPSLMLV